MFFNNILGKNAEKLNKFSDDYKNYKKYVTFLDNLVNTKGINTKTIPYNTNKLLVSLKDLEIKENTLYFNGITSDNKKIPL